MLVFTFFNMGAVLCLPIKRFVTVSFNPKDLSNLYSNRRKVSSFYFGRLVGSNLALEKAFMAVNGYHRTVMKDSRHQI